MFCRYVNANGLAREDHNHKTGWSQLSLIVVISSILAACSGDRTQQTNDSFPAAEDVLEGPDVLAETVEINVVADTTAGLTR